MVKSKEKQALQQAQLHYITALTDPGIRRLLKQGTLQPGLLHEEVCEVQAEGVRYVLRKNEAEAAHERHRFEDKLRKLEARVAVRNQKVKNSPRCRPEAGRRTLEDWAARHKLTSLVKLKLEDRTLLLEREMRPIGECIGNQSPIGLRTPKGCNRT